MVYNPATDFLGLWRTSGGAVSKAEMPGLDYVIAALARAGVITVSVSATAPVANQSTTAWLQAAVPSYSAEGTFRLWDKVTSAYLPATPALFLQFLEATAGENSTRWWTSTGGPPLNTVGNNGDFALRTDNPYGIYGPKALGAWPATPVPGTADVITSASLDNTFGTARGELIVRGAAAWQALPVGAANSVLASDGVDPTWATLNALIDSVFGNVQGSILYRAAGVWNDLPPGVATQVLQTNGPAADPSWAARTAEFPSGTVMLFRQSASPPGWTKQIAIDDYGIRVVGGAVGSTAGTAFSTVFAQTTTGSHVLDLTEIPSHTHTLNNKANIVDSIAGGVIGGGGAFGAQTNSTSIGSSGGGLGHTHPISLALAYVDVIMASKD